MSVYKLHGTNTGADGIAQLDIREDGWITGVVITARPSGMDAANDYHSLEVSFSSSNSWSTNDVRASIFMAKSSVGLLTSGSADVGINASIGGVRIRVNQGERVYLHGTTSAGGGGLATAYLYVEDKSEKRPIGRRGQ